MRAIKLTANIGDDHRLNVQLPNDVPPGIAEVILLFSANESVNNLNDLKSFTEWLDQQPRYTRSKEEIDRYLEEERNSWERDDVRNLPR